MLAVLWSTASHWVLGVPFDMISRARREGGQTQIDLETMVRINVDRMLYISRSAGIWLIGFVTFVISALGILGFYYWIEVAQALLFLMAPVTILMMLSLRTAVRIESGENSGDTLHRRLFRHRVSTQFLGMIAIFVTSLFGMWQNMHLSYLG